MRVGQMRVGQMIVGQMIVGQMRVWQMKGAILFTQMPIKEEGPISFEARSLWKHLHNDSTNS